ncbi:MAG: D-alanine--D-alanine ligase [Planctomycetota bacterium]
MTSTTAACSSVELAGRRVAVLSGGRSTEREVSLVSGAAIGRALSAAGDGRGPARVVAVEIQPDGLWRVEGARPCGASEAIAKAAVDVWFLALHGGEGEDGRIQALLAASNAAHTGTGTRGSALAMDKSAARAGAARAGLRVPNGFEWRRGEALDTARSTAVRGATGWFVKPVSGGSSVGAGPASSLDELERLGASAHEFDPLVLVEERLEGTEASVGVLELEGVDVCALPPIEIRPRKAHFFDYDEKYAPDGALELCPAESLSTAALGELQRAAVVAHRVLRAEGYSRSDFLVQGDDVVFLELNTLPGFTDRSLVPQEAAALGVDYRSLCLAIAADGLERGVRR